MEAEDDAVIEAKLVEVVRLVEVLCDRIDDDDVVLLDDELSSELEELVVAVVDVCLTEDVELAIVVFAFVAVPVINVTGAVEKLPRPHSQSARSPLNACAITVSGLTPWS